MRHAIIAIVLPISLFSVSASAQFASPAFEQDGTSIFSLERLNDQDIRDFHNDRKVCDKIRFDGGVPYISLEVAKAVVQACMDFRFAANTHAAGPEWHESFKQAEQLCTIYASDPAFGSAAHRGRARALNIRDCLIVEFNYPR